MVNKSLPSSQTCNSCGGDAARKPGRSGSAGIALAESAFDPVCLRRWLGLGLLACVPRCRAALMPRSMR